MIKDSEKQKFNVVIVWKLDRFARNRYDSATYKSKLKKNAVKVISATETISQNAEGILLESMLEGMAEYYSAELAEKVGRGMTENALKCKFNGGTVPIGYTINEDQFFEVDPVKAPYVVQAFEAYANGKTIKEIVDMLNVKGLTTSLGSKITINIVTDMLKNRRYIGEYKFRDIVQKDGIPRIVPQALFDKVQSEKNKRATARHKAEDDYLLTTKLFCGKCGRYMTGESGTGRSGAVHRYYKCNGAKYKHACDKKTVKKDWIENLVIKYTREMMMSDNVLEDIAGIVFRNFQKENPVIQLLKQRLSETETALNNLLKAIEEGIITSTTKQRILELEQTRDEINLKLIKEEMKKPTITKEGLILWLKQIQAMNLETKEHKQRLIDIFVNAVYLYDDKLVIAFNYKEATKTVSLKEVNGSIIECSGAPKYGIPQRGIPYFYTVSLTRTHLNATRTSVAAEGLPFGPKILNANAFVIFTSSFFSLILHIFNYFCQPPLRPRPKPFHNDHTLILSTFFAQIFIPGKSVSPFGIVGFIDLVPAIQAKFCHNNFLLANFVYL